MSPPRELKHGPLAERSATASKLNFGKGERRITNNLGRLAKGPRALLCAEIRLETGNERPAKTCADICLETGNERLARRCAGIAHAEFLKEGKPLAARAIEEKFGLCGPAVKKRVVDAIRTHHSNGSSDTAMEIASVYGLEGERTKVLMDLLGAELSNIYLSHRDVGRTIDKYEERGLSRDDITSVIISLTARLLMNPFSSLFARAPLHNFLPEPQWPSAEERVAIRVLVDSSPLDKAISVFRSRLTGESGPSKGAEVLGKAVSELREKGQVSRAYKLCEKCGMEPPLGLRREMVLHMVRTGEYEDAITFARAHSETSDLVEFSSIVAQVQIALGCNPDIASAEMQVLGDLAEGK